MTVTTQPTDLDGSCLPVQEGLVGREDGRGLGARQTEPRQTRVGDQVTLGETQHLQSSQVTEDRLHSGYRDTVRHTM